MWHIAISLLFVLQAASAQAAASQWLRSEGGDVRIVATAPKPDGTIPAILDIRLKDGWKTYWIDPGDGGIAPRISFSPDSNVEFSGIALPVPSRFDDGTVRYSGYDRPVAFPLKLKGGGGQPLTASVFLGICKDICIPVNGDLSVDLQKDGGADLLEKAIIAAAQADLPEEPSADFTLKSYRIDRERRRVHLVLTVPPDTSAGTADIFLAGPSGEGFGMPENLSVEGSELTAEVPILGKGTAEKLGGKTITLLAVSGRRSMQTTLAFE